MHLHHFTIASLILFSCQAPEPAPKTSEQTGDTSEPYIMDTHSFARPQEAVIKHLDLDITVNMAGHQISGTAAYTFDLKQGHTITFDAEGLQIDQVTDQAGRDLAFELAPPTPLGQALVITVSDTTNKVVIAYSTGAHAKALQWLKPEQTAGKKDPFLFTQGQAILTRTWIPIQDSPGIRITYDATVTVPKGLMAVMSASNPQVRSDDGVYHFKMEQPIPPYLLALSVGDIDFKAVGPRTGVYAEPSMLEKAAYEFGDMEQLVKAAEELYGPYRWDRYDVIVLPPSFPFGGMENPRLTFATPTILAGDRSLNSLIAHELAHSWSGNLVTNATWDDFWLNEGFTVYFEKRISEKVYGKEFAQMLDLLGYQDLQQTIGELNAKGKMADTHLKLALNGRNPDDGMTDVAYEKGYAFLRVIEEAVGREKLDAFLRDYFDRFAFKTMTTERFIDHLNKELLGPDNVQINIDEWVYGPGLPANFVVPVSDRFKKVDAEITAWDGGEPATKINAKDWSTFEWMHFVRHLPEGLSPKRMAELDKAFNLTASGNSEIAAAWLEASIRNGYEPAYPRLEEFLTTVGRRKFLVPLYKALLAREGGKERALAIYQKARGNYHSVSTGTLDELLGPNKGVAASSAE